MKNIALDIMMGLIVIVLCVSIFGLIVLDDVLYSWANMRKK